ncbi:MAG: heavy-metal-associated domain-containing protein [Microthrixaceae bacterium]
MTQPSTTRTITVEGMTCGHCVGAVQEELAALDGVQQVDVDLASGAVQIRSDSPLSDEQIHAAVDEAGYSVVS